MSKTFRKTLLAGAILTALAAPASAALLSFGTPEAPFRVGELFEVSVQVSELAAPLGAFDLQFNYNPGVLTFSHYTLGDALGSIDLFEALDFSMGEVAAGAVHLGSLSLLTDLSSQPLSFTLGSLYFTALKTSPTRLSLSAVNLSSDWGEAIAATTASVRVNAVPEPGSMALLLGGLGLMGFAARRRG